jgi:hypothetical protein
LFVEFREDKEQRKEWKKKWDEGHQKGNEAVTAETSGPSAEV